jgi:hypothetical protein
VKWLKQTSESVRVCKEIDGINDKYHAKCAAKQTTRPANSERCVRNDRRISCQHRVIIVRIILFRDITPIQQFTLKSIQIVPNSAIWQTEITVNWATKQVQMKATRTTQGQ